MVAQRPFLRSDLGIWKLWHKFEWQQLHKSLHGDWPRGGSSLGDSLSKLLLSGRCSKPGEHAWVTCSVVTYSALSPQCFFESYRSITGFWKCHLVMKTSKLFSQWRIRLRMASLLQERRKRTPHLSFFKSQTPQRQLISLICIAIF